MVSRKLQEPGEETRHVDQLWFDHPEMRARIARAEDDFERGRSIRTETPEQAQALLDGLKKSRLSVLA